MAARRVNEYDIKQAGSIQLLISQLVDQVKAGNMETKEYGSQLLRSLTDQPAKLEMQFDKKRDRGSGMSLGATAASDLDGIPVQQIMPGGQENGLPDHCVLIASAGGIKPLVILLKEGSANGQRDACGALANIARGRENYQQLIIDAGGVISMANLLRAGDASSAEQAAAALASVSQNLNAQKLILGSGAINPLVNLLKVNQRHEAQIRSAEALANLAQNSDDGCTAVAKAGAIPRILELLGTGKAAEACSRALAKLAHGNLQNQTDICRLGGVPKLLPPLSGVNVEAQVQAASALAELASGERCRRRQDAIAKSGGIRPLLQLVESRYSQAQCMSLHALAELATNHRGNQDAIAGLEGLAPLVTLISAGGASPDVQTYAARTLAQLVKHNEKNQTSVADLGAISLLVSLMRQTSTPTVEAEVAGALYALGESHPANQGAIVSSGAISVLVGLLGSRSDHAARLAANALSSLGLENKDSQSEMTKLLVQMLTTAKRESTQERAAGALWRLVRQNPADQKLIATSGGAQPLVKLLREGPQGAKAFALWSLSLCISDENRQVIIEAGAIGPLVELITSEDASVAEQSAGALAKLAVAGGSPQERSRTLVSIAKHGAIAPLIALLDGPVFAARQHAAAALSELALVPSHRNTIDLCGGIPPLVKVLTDPHADGPTKKFAAAAVGLLSAEEGGDDSTPAPPPQQQQQQQQQAESGSEPPSPVPASPVPGGADSPDRSPSPVNLPPASPGATTPGQAGSTPGGASPSPMRKGKSPLRKTAIASEGAIAPLVSLLTKGDAEQEEAAGALRALAEHAGIRLAITESGGIGPLVMMLGGSNPKARDNAEGALVRLSTEMANRVLIIQQLVGMLQDTGIAAREQAAAAIANLARESTANCTSIVDAGGIPPLLALLLSDSAKAKENSASAISQLASGSKPTQNAISKAGGIPLLVGVLTASSSNKNDMSQGQLETIVLHAIWKMAKKNFANQVALVEAGVIAPLVTMLGNSSPEMQLPATGAIECLLQAKDIQAAVVRTGAIAPLCMLSRDGMTETQEQAAAALWSLSIDNAPNKTTIAKLGGIDALVKMVVTGGSDKAQRNAAGALATLASKHVENRTSIAKRIVSLLSDRGLYGKVDAPVAGRALSALTRMCGRKMADDETQLQLLSADNTANQLAISKAGGVPAIITWLSNADEEVQKEASHALLAMSTGNIQTQTLIAKVEGLQGLIGVVNGNIREAQEHAALALWHLAYSTENQLAIAEAGGIPALVGMLGLAGDKDGTHAAELAAVTMVRLAQGNPEVSVIVADVGGIVPLVMLLRTGTSAAQQAAAALAELGLVAKNRDPIANAGGIEPLIKLLNSHTIGTPETAARALAHLARSEDSDAGNYPATAAEQLNQTSRGEAKPKMQVAVDGEGDGEESDDDDRPLKIQGVDARRAYIKRMGGVSRLVAMLDGSNLKREDDSAEKRTAASLWGKATKLAEEVTQQVAGLPGGESASGIQVGMMEQAAAALSELTFGDIDMQDAVIDADGVPKLLQLVVAGSSMAQEHAAATFWHLSTSIDNQARLVTSGCIPELVKLLGNGSHKAQEAASGALANLARGAHYARGEQQIGQEQPSSPSDNDSFRQPDAVSPDGSPAGTPSKQPSPTRDDPLAGAVDSSAIVGERAKKRGFMRRVSVLPGIGNVDAFALALEAVKPEEELFHFIIDVRLAGEPVPVDADVASALATLGGNVLSNPQPVAVVRAVYADDVASADLMDVESIELLTTEAVIAEDEEGEASKEGDGLSAIVEANGIPPIVTLLGSKLATPKAKELAAAALWHLAADPTSRDIITQCAGIAPLVGLLDGGSHQAHRHASDALARLANGNKDNQSQIAKRLVSLLMANNTATVQERAAHALQMLASDNPGSTIIIVKAGAISPLVHLLSTASEEGVKKSTAEALETLVADSDHNQSAVTDLVVLLGTGSPKAQELVLQMLMTLADDFSNRKAIAQSGALPKLVMQLDYSVVKVQELAAAVLSHLVRDSSANVEMIASQGGIPRLVALLDSTSMEAQAYSAAVLADLCQSNEPNHSAVMKAGSIPYLVQMLSLGGFSDARAEAAGALGNLAFNRHWAGDAQVAIVKAGAIQPLVDLLKEEHHRAQRKAAVAVAHVVAGIREHQDSVRHAGGVECLVALLGDSTREDVQAYGAAALAEMACDNVENQTAIAAADGLPRTVRLLQEANTERAVEAASSALRHFAARHSANQITIAAVGGILPLVLKLGTGNETVREETTEALANLAEGNADNEATIATLLVKLLYNRSTAARGAHAIAKLGHQLGTSTQDAFAKVGGLNALVTWLKPDPELDADGKIDTVSEGETSVVVLQLEAAGALRSMAADHSNNQVAISNVGAIPLLVKILTGSNGSSPKSKRRGSIAMPAAKPAMQAPAASVVAGRMAARKSMSSTVDAARLMDTAVVPGALRVGGRMSIIEDKPAELQCNAAAALWKLAFDSRNQQLIADAKGITPLVLLLRNGNDGAQEAAAGALRCMADSKEVRDRISASCAVTPLTALVENGTTDAKAQAAGCLALLAIESESNQELTATELMTIFESPTASEEACEYACRVACDLACEGKGNFALQQAEAVPHLVKQVSQGTSIASDKSARALAEIANVSPEVRSTVTHTLINARHNATDPKVVVRIVKALDGMESEGGDQDDMSQQAVGLAILMFRIHTRD